MLLLDEPTNHLDLQVKESLLEVLMAFDGAVVFVSHNRDFADALATVVVEVGGGGIQRCELGFEAFLWRRALELGYDGRALPGLPAPELWPLLRARARRAMVATGVPFATSSASSSSAATPVPKVWVVPLRRRLGFPSPAMNPPHSWSPSRTPDRARLNAEPFVAVRP